MANVHLWAADWESSTLTDYGLGSVAAQASQDTTTYKNGTGSLKAHMTSGAQSGTVAIANSRFTWRKILFRTDHQVSGMPTSSNPHIVLDFGGGGTNYIMLYSSHYAIHFGSNPVVVGSATINANEWHQVEIIADKDWSTNGSIIVRIDGTVDATYNLSGSDTFPTLTSSLVLNTNATKSSSNPGSDEFMDNTVIIWSDATPATQGWMGTAVVSHRMAASAGTYNDFTGTPDASNKYNNVSEIPNDGDTSYNYKTVLYDGVSSPTLATGAAGILNGTYKYKLTLVNASGETLASSAGSISPANQQVNLTNIWTGSGHNVHGVTQRKIYRTVAGGSTYKLLTTIADDTTTSYTDNTADGSLGANEPVSNTTNTLTLGRQTSKVTNVASYSSSILGACMFITRRETTSALQNVDMLVYFNSTEYTYNDGHIYLSYTPFFQGWQNRPSDGSAWTASDLNNVEIGVKADGTTLIVTFEEKVTQVMMTVVTVTDPNVSTSIPNKITNINQAINRSNTY